jgi:hypothetical protein
MTTKTQGLTLPPLPAFLRQHRGDVVPPEATPARKSGAALRQSQERWAAFRAFEDRLRRQADKAALKRFRALFPDGPRPGTGKSTVERDLIWHELKARERTKRQPALDRRRAALERADRRGG